MEQMDVDGDGSAAGAGALLRAYSKRPQGGGGLGGLGGLSCSQSQNRDAIAVKGDKSSAGEAYARELRGAYDAMDEPVDAIREVGDQQLQQLFNAMLAATAGGGEVGEQDRRDDLLVSLGMACIEDASLVAGRRGKEVIDFVCNEIQHLQPDKCVLLMETLLNNISRDGEKRVDKETNEQYVIEVDTRCFDLIPKLLSTISKASSVMFPSTGRSDSGAEYQVYTIQQIIRISWSRRLTLALADTLRYLRVSSGQLEQCVDKMLDESRRLNRQDLPHLVYHVLLLSSQGERTSILRKVLEMINDVDAKCMDMVGSTDLEANLSQLDVVQSVASEHDMCLAEGTVLQHFDFSVKQDQVLGQEVLKILKQRQCQLTPFEVALLLQMSTVQRYETNAVQILKKAAEQDCTYLVKMATSTWINGISSLQAPSSIEDTMKIVMKRTKMGWEHLVPAIVGFASAMLCTYAKKCHDGNSPGFGSKSVPQRMVHLASTLLEKAFTLHTPVRDEIILQILSHVITRDEVVPHFIALLAKISARCSRDVMENIPKIKDALEYISYMPPKTAVAFLEALAPIMRIQSSLHDYVIIVLRKALFSREGEARIVALDCLLHLASSSAPLSAEAADRPGNSSGRVAAPTDELAVDVIGQIRRCMVQQLAVRQRLYDGLYEMTRSKPAMLDTIANVITPHLLKYVILGDKGSCELAAGRCMEKGIALEPLPHLLRCAVRCVHAHSEILAEGGESGAGLLAGGDESLLKLRAVLEGLSGYFAEFDLDMIEIELVAKSGSDGKNVSYDGRSQTNQDFVEKGDALIMEARIWHGAFEVMLEHSFLCQHVSASRLDGRCKKLFDKMQKIETALKPKGKAHDLPPTLLTAEYTVLLLSCTKSQGDVRVEGKARTAIFSNLDLAIHGLRTCCKQIQALKGRILEGGTRKTRACADLKQMAPLLVRQFYANLHAKRSLPIPAGQNAKKKGGEETTTKSVAALALAGLQACLELMCTWGTMAQISEVAGAIVSEIVESRCDESILPEDSVSQAIFQRSKGQTINNCIHRMQSMVKRLMEDGDQEEASCVLSCLLHVLRCLPMDERDVHYVWFEHLAKAIKGGRWTEAMLKDVASTYLMMSSGERDMTTAVKLSQDVRRLVGISGESDHEGAADVDHGLLGEEESEARVGISVACDFVKSCCDEVDWALAHVESMARPDIMLDDKLSDDPVHVEAASSNNASEDEVMVRLHKLVLVLLPMAESNLSVPRCLAAVVDALCRLYQSAEGAARRVLRSQTVPRERFAALMKTIGSKLNEQMYESIDRFAKSRFDETGVNSRTGSKSQLSKEQKLVPNIIYFVESLEKHLIKISKKPKSIDLMRGFKRSTARDFKVDFGKITNPEEKKKKDKKDKDDESSNSDEEGGKKKRKSKGKEKEKAGGPPKKRGKN